MSRSRDGRVDPAFGWIAKDYLGIDQGPILAMICNYRNELVWDDMRKCMPLRRGLARAGFTGGWLDQDGLMPGAAPRPADHGRRRAIRRIGWGSVALAAGSLAGCGRSKTDPEGPLDFWAMGREAEVVVELLAAFRAAPSRACRFACSSCRGRQRTRSS